MGRPTPRPRVPPEARAARRSGSYSYVRSRPSPFAGGVAVDVVDVLEVIEVQQDAGERAAVALGGDEVIAHTSRLLAEDPLNGEAHFHRGLAQLERGDPSGAVGSLRRALYIDSGFGLAAFTLGSAREALGDRGAARRAYERALRTLRPDERHHQLLGQIDLNHITTAARERLQGLSRTPG